MSMVVPFSDKLVFTKDDMRLETLEAIMPEIIENWCNENCEGKFLEVLLDKDHEFSVSYYSAIYFELDSDAVMFKLALPLNQIAKVMRFTDKNESGRGFHCSI